MVSDGSCMNCRGMRRGNDMRGENCMRSIDMRVGSLMRLVQMDGAVVGSSDMR